MANGDNYIDEKEIKEIFKEATPSEANLPEAPLSINIGSYYKGFYVGWTKRSSDTEVSDKIDKIKSFVEHLVAAGFEPSWNKQTSKEALKPEGEKFADSMVEDNSPVCPFHQKPMTKGKWGWYCKTKIEVGDKAPVSKTGWCGYRPNHYEFPVEKDQKTYE